jgi:hypothetical protein
MLVADAIDLLDHYREFRAKEQIQDQGRAQAARNLFENLSRDIGSRLRCLEPGQVLRHAYEDASIQSGARVREWNDWMSHLRSTFQEALSRRDLCISREFLHLQQSDATPERSAALDIALRLDREPQTSSLPNFIDPSFNPIACSYLHEFNPSYTASEQQPVDACYISRLLKSLSVPERSKIESVLGREEAAISRSLAELRRLRPIAESRYALSLINLKCVRPSLVQKDASFRRMEQELSKLREGLVLKENAFGESFKMFGDRISDWRDRLRKTRSQIEEIQQSFQFVNPRRYALDMEGLYLEYFERLWSTTRGSLSPSSASAPFRDWEQQEAVFVSLLNECQSEEDIGIVESLIGEIMMLKTRLAAGVHSAKEFIRNTTKLKQDLLIRSGEGVEDEGAEVERQTAPTEMLAEQGAQDNVIRAVELENLERAVKELFGSFCTFGTHVKSDVIEGRGSAGAERARIESYRERLEAVCEIVKERRNSIAKLQEIAEVKEVAPVQEKSKPTEDGIGLVYAEARAGLACDACDIEARYYLPACAHVMCATCQGKARGKGKTIQCPVCRAPNPSSVVIDY